MANSGPAEGTYRIVCGGSDSDHPYCLDVGGGDMSSGANVQIWGRLYAASQYWKVTYDSGGSARIVSLASGKTLDVYGGTMANGTNVRQFNDNGTSAQRWDLVADGGDGVCDGEHYDTYKILSHKSNSYALDVDGSSLANKKNVQIWSAYETIKQRWMFVPMPAFASGGTYEIRSMLKTSMTLDVSGGSTANGANVQLWSANGSNAQKFYVTEETSGQWSIMNVNSGKYVDVKGGASAVGSNVQQYADNDSRSQRWKLTQYGTTTIDGKVCAVVTLGSYVDGSGSTRLMDVKNAMTSNSANVQLGAWESGTDYSQRFALYPTSPKDTDLVVPADLGWVEAIGDTDRKLVQNEAEVLYPAWRTATSWTTDSSNGYQMRYRMQTRSAATGSWGEFGDWSEWSPIAVSVSKSNVWMADGLPATVSSGCIALQYEVQVRAITYEGDSDDDGRTGGVLKTGDFTAATLRANAVVELEIGGTLGYGPEGLRLPYTTGYDGTINMQVYEVKTSNGKNLLSKPVVFEDLDSSGSVLIPVSGLTRWLNDGETVGINYTWSTDEGYLNQQNGQYEYGFIVSYNTGSGLSVTPTVTVGTGRTFEVAVVSANVSKAWVRSGGVISEMPVINHVGHILYPFGESFPWELFVAAHSSDGDRWGVALIDGSQYADLVAHMPPCHAWNWDGGSFLLEMRKDEPLETEYSVKRNVATHQLDAREWESVHYAPTKSGEFTAEGALSALANVEGTRDALEELCEPGYCVYRSPSGLMCDVAVTGYRITEGSRWSTVSVEMRRVTN